VTHYPETPWNLTPGEQRALDAVTEAYGDFKQAANDTGANYHTMHIMVGRARDKMAAKNVTMAALMWDRFRRAA
jgi:hypothetical protein